MRKAKKAPRRQNVRKKRKNIGLPPPQLGGEKLQRNFEGAVRFLQAGKLARAESLCRKVLRANPDHCDALHVLGLACNEQGRPEDSIHHLRKAARLNTSFADIPNNLGSTLSDLGRHEEAIGAFRQAIGLQPDYARAHSNLGVALREVGRLEDAVSSYRQAIALEPDFMEAHTNMAIALESLGNIDGATASSRRAVKSASSNRHTSVDVLKQFYKLSQLQISSNDGDILSIIDEMEPEAAASKEKFETLRAATRATLLDKAGSHRQAWENLVIANRLTSHQKQSEYLNDRQQRKALLAHLRNGSAGTIPDDVPSQSMSLHILGPSRSGKTTLENLVAVLNGVARGHENRIVQDAWHDALDALNLPRTMPTTDVSLAVATEFRERYVHELEKKASGARIFTNTVPKNIEAVSLIATTLPNQRFVFLQRDVADISLRIYMKIYNFENAYAYDIGNILEYLNWYDEMIGILSERFPSISRVIRYEDMVADQAATLRSVAELCGAAVPTDLDLLRLGDDRGCGAPYRAFMFPER